MRIASWHLGLLAAAATVVVVRGARAEAAAEVAALDADLGAELAHDAELLAAVRAQLVAAQPRDLDLLRELHGKLLAAGLTRTAARFAAKIETLERIT